MKKPNIYIQSICSNCLQKLVNDEGDHTEEELKEYNYTLDQWAKLKYYPSGLTENTEPSFSWQKCDICDAIAGERYEYYFRDEQEGGTDE